MVRWSLSSLSDEKNSEHERLIDDSYYIVPVDLSMFASIPDDVIQEIFAYLEALELANMARVGKRMKVVSERDRLWRTLVQRDFFQPKQGFSLSNVLKLTLNLDLASSGSKRAYQELHMDNIMKIRMEEEEKEQQRCTNVCRIIQELVPAIMIPICFILFFVFLYIDLKPVLSKKSSCEYWYERDCGDTPPWEDNAVTIDWWVWSPLLIMIGFFLLSLAWSCCYRYAPRNRCCPCNNDALQRVNGCIPACIRLSGTSISDAFSCTTCLLSVSALLLFAYRCSSQFSEMTFTETMTPFYLGVFLLMFIPFVGCQDNMKTLIGILFCLIVPFVIFLVMMMLVLDGQMSVYSIPLIMLPLFILNGCLFLVFILGGQVGIGAFASLFGPPLVVEILVCLWLDDPYSDHNSFSTLFVPMYFLGGALLLTGCVISIGTFCEAPQRYRVTSV